MSTKNQEDAAKRAEALAQLTVSGRRLSDAVVLFHTRAAEAFGLGTSESKALGFIQQFGPISHRELTARLGLKPASVTNILDRLEAKGWIQRKKSPTDARSILLTVVPEKVEHFRAVVFGPLMSRMQSVYDGFDTEQLVLISQAFEAIAAAQEAAARDLNGTASVP